MASAAGKYQGGVLTMITYRGLFGLTCLTTLLLLSNLAARENKELTIPMTRTDTVVDTIHGVEVADPYRWLENADDPEVKAWVEKQNAFTRSVLDNLPERDKIRQRLD